jgi:hypothetical protein
MSKPSQIVEEFEAPTPAKRLRDITEVRNFARYICVELERHGNFRRNLERARLLLYGSQCLGTLMRDVEANERFNKLEKEIAELKASIIRRVG